MIIAQGTVSQLEAFRILCAFLWLWHARLLRMGGVFLLIQQMW